MGLLGKKFLMTKKSAIAIDEIALIEFDYKNSNGESGIIIHLKHPYKVISNNPRDVVASTVRIITGNTEEYDLWLEKLKTLFDQEDEDIIHLDNL